MVLEGWKFGRMWDGEGSRKAAKLGSGGWLGKTGAVRNADRMNQHEIRVWYFVGRVRRKTAPTHL